MIGFGLVRLGDGRARWHGRLAASLMVLVFGLAAPGAWAACKRIAGITPFQVNLDMGTILIQPSTPVGTVLATKRFHPVSTTHDVATCTNGGTIRHDYVQGSPVSGFSNVFSTDIQGVGIRIKFYSGDGLGATTDYYPILSTITGNRNIEMRATSFYDVEVIKTEAMTGTGPLATGRVARFFGDDNKDLGEIFVPANGITIVTPTCEVDSGSRNILVQLGKVAHKNFTGVGSTAGSRQFSIQLNCSAGVAAANTVHIRMDATPDPSGQQGVLQLASGTNAATGVGIQVLDSTSVGVKFGEDALVGPSKDGSYILPYTARYFQTAPNVTAGVANGMATFNLNYK